MVGKVIDPNKIVTDSLLIKRLAEQGIDKDYVELSQGYAPRSLGKEHSPCAKFYRDLKSDKRFMVASGLPKVNPDGQSLLPVWVTHGKDFKQETNLFDARTYKGELKLTCLCNQPTGIKKFEQVTWNPRLFLNGSEVNPIKDYPNLLDVDPINKNYQLNTLEWDYGVCKRRVRLIEGRLRERWIFPSNPNADVRIKHNFTGKGVKLSGAFDAEFNPLNVIITADEEFIPATEFTKAVYPVQVGASATYYPDADAETTSVDGRALQYYSGGNEVTWATLIAAAGNQSADDEADHYAMYMRAQGVDSNDWDQLTRSIFLFDSSGLPDAASISAATMSVYGNAKADGLSVTPDLNVYLSAPASNTGLVAGDYDSLGSTAYCDTAITYAGFSTTGYNDWAFNATGIAAVSKTGVSKFGLRNVNYDVDAVSPTESDADSRFQIYFADQGSNKPKLVVTYTVGVVPRHGFVNFQVPGIV